MDTLRDKIYLNKLWEDGNAMENLEMIKSINQSFGLIKGFVTGDTGFKGG